MPTLLDPKDLTEPGERAVPLSNCTTEDWIYKDVHLSLYLALRSSFEV
jgi:hypothetical protein